MIRPVDPRPLRRLPKFRLDSRYVAAGVVALVAAYTFVALWFVNRAPEFDELGLFNAAYMFAHTGAVTYPIYPAAGATTAMFVHPPTHYLILGLLMRAHLPVEAAALVPVIVWTVVAVAAGMLCPFSNAARFAVAAGVTAGMVMWALPFFIRPDADMAATWIAGLIVLEGARLRGWNPVLLGVGAFLLTLASELHYPMTPAFLGLGVYAVWVVRDLGFRRATPRLGALVAGALVPGLPYLVVFVIPHYAEIRAITRGANGGFQPLRSFRAEIAAYRSMVASNQGGTLLSVIAAPFTRSRIPVGVAFVPFLYWRRDTRGIALACLPGLLFLMFFDTENHQFYSTGEFTLYFIAVAYAAGLAVTSISRRLGASATLASSLAAVIVLSVVLVLGRPAIDAFGTRTWHPTHREMDIARAAGRVIGDDGVVASFDASTVWYTTGGSAYYPLWRDISSETNLQRLNLRAYLAQLPALAESNNGTEISYWAERRLITARGFYFDWPLSSARVTHEAHQGWEGSSRISYVIYSSVPVPVVGVAQGRHNALVFTPRPDGPWEFVSASCQGSSASIGKIGPWSLAAGVPASFGPNGGQPTDSHVIVSAVASPLSIARSAALNEHDCTILRKTRLAARAVSVQQLLAEAHKLGADRTMQFPGWVPAVDALYGPRGRLTRLDYAEPLGVPVLGPGAKWQVSGDSVTVTAPSKLYAQAAAVPLQLPGDRARLWIGVRVDVTKGTVGMCVLDAVRDACPYPLRQLLAPGSGLVYLEVPNTQDKLEVYVQNLTGGSAEITISGSGDLVRAAPS
jgi:hypothetical protein